MNMVNNFAVEETTQEISTQTLSEGLWIFMNCPSTSMSVISKTPVDDDVALNDDCAVDCKWEKSAPPWVDTIMRLRFRDPVAVFRDGVLPGVPSVVIFNLKNAGGKCGKNAIF